jgi:hypothetical protein
VQQRRAEAQAQLEATRQALSQAQEATHVSQDSTSAAIHEMEAKLQKALEEAAGSAEATARCLQLQAQLDSLEASLCQAREASTAAAEQVSHVKAKVTLRQAPHKLPHSLSGAAFAADPFA